MAAVTEDGREMLRLYPIRYRHLPKSRQFSRYDLVEMLVDRPRDDHRAESRHVDEESIRIISRGTELSDVAKIQLWKPHISPSLTALHDENVKNGRSFGIVRPDLNSLKFFIERESEADTASRKLNQAGFQQVSLFEQPLAELPKTEYSFGYRFTSDGHAHKHYIHDWEVQAAYLSYRRRYKEDALSRLRQEYGENIPSHNPHFVMGTMKAHPQTFITIGILRTGLDPVELDKQGGLF